MKTTEFKIVVKYSLFLDKSKEIEYNFLKLNGERKKHGHIRKGESRKRTCQINTTLRVTEIKIQGVCNG